MSDETPSHESSGHHNLEAEVRVLHTKTDNLKEMCDRLEKQQQAIQQEITENKEKATKENKEDRQSFRETVEKVQGTLVDLKSSVAEDYGRKRVIRGLWGVVITMVAAFVGKNWESLVELFEGALL